MDDEIDEVQLEQLRKSYKEVVEMDFTGFMNKYLKDTIDIETLTTKATQDMIFSLAQTDSLRDQTFLIFSDLTLNLSLIFQF